MRLGDDSGVVGVSGTVVVLAIYRREKSEDRRVHEEPTEAKWRGGVGRLWTLTAVSAIPSLLTFDGITTNIIITIITITTIGPVLQVLPMRLEGDAQEWHNGLSTRLREEMNHDLAIWKDELLREYRPDRFESLKKAEKMKSRRVLANI